MLKLNPHIIKIAKSKALQSHCRYKVSALGFNRKNDLIDYVKNEHRWEGKGRGSHSEMIIMLHNPTSLKSIIICRVNKKGDFLPIDPCKTCAEKAKELGIKIYTIK
jgi:hypothetical protein